MTLDVLSYGGGVQSTALLVLAARGAVKIDAAIFVELDAENPDTIQYVKDVAEPFCARFGIRFVRVNVSLMRMIEERPDFPLVPFKDYSGKLFGKRQCTNHAKVRPFRRALRALMRESRVKRANVAYGISIDEMWRVRDSDVRYIKNIYPLIELGLDRNTCWKIIDAEIPTPTKSSCWFCPFSSSAHQMRLVNKYPRLRREAELLQAKIDQARAASGADRLMVLHCDMQQQDMLDFLCGGTCHT